MFSCHYFVYNYGFPFYPLERDMGTFLPSERFFKCLQHDLSYLPDIILLYVAETLDEMNVITFKYVFINFIMGKTDCAIVKMVYMTRTQNF